LNTILVTGGSGFIGSHSILQLLATGHQVRTTVRNLKREGEVRAMLKEGGAVPGDRFSFIAAPRRCQPPTRTASSIVFSRAPFPCAFRGRAPSMCRLRLAAEYARDSYRLAAQNKPRSRRWATV
jgi:hypothetical protein